MRDYDHLERLIAIPDTHLNAARLGGEHGFAVHAGATAGGHDDDAIMEPIAEVSNSARGESLALGGIVQACSSASRQLLRGRMRRGESCLPVPVMGEA
jgi:hypothetical protein